MSVKDRANICPQVLRQKREKLFKAFDIYKQNVGYGLLSETQETHENLTRWYQDCCDLKVEAIQNPPQCLIKYIK